MPSDEETNPVFPSAIRRAYDLLLAGVSPGSIAGTWNAAGLPTGPDGGPARTGQRGTWTADRVRAVLADPGYAGGLVDEPTWRSATALLSVPPRRGRGGRGPGAAHRDRVLRAVRPAGAVRGRLPRPGRVPVRRRRRADPPGPQLRPDRRAGPARRCSTGWTARRRARPAGRPAYPRPARAGRPLGRVADPPGADPAGRQRRAGRAAGHRRGADGRPRRPGRVRARTPEPTRSTTPGTGSRSPASAGSCSRWPSGSSCTRSRRAGEPATRTSSGRAS